MDSYTVSKKLRDNEMLKETPVIVVILQMKSFISPELTQKKNL